MKSKNLQLALLILAWIAAAWYQVSAKLDSQRSRQRTAAALEAQARYQALTWQADSTAWAQEKQARAAAASLDTLAGTRLLFAR